MQKTLDYLLHDIIQEYGIKESHSFVRDRARAIRNDLTLQNYRGIEAVILHERIARYHIMCSNLLCGDDGFVMQQEVEQLRKTLVSLIEFYSEMAKNNVKMPNEAEFQAYYILIFPYSNDIVSKMEKELADNVFFDPKVQLALEIRSLLTRRYDNKRPSVDGSLNHYSKVFSILRRSSTSYLFACCVHVHFMDIRKSALASMQKSYYLVDKDPSSGFPLDEAVEILGFDDQEECIEYLNHYFVEVKEVDGQLIAYIGRKVVEDQNGKKAPDFPKFPCKLLLI
jgi:hypothetical protein